MSIKHKFKESEIEVVQVTYEDMKTKFDTAKEEAQHSAPEHDINKIECPKKSDKVL